MFKNFFMGIAAMAALTLVSCSSDDLNSLSDTPSKNEAISFDSYLGRSAVSVNGSRGSVLEIDDLKSSTEGFGVFGNYSSTDGEAFGSNLFDNQKVTYSSTNEKWEYTPVKYWSPQGHIDFLAYAPRVDGTTLNGSSIEFTVADNAADQKDLLWANAANQTMANNSGTKKYVKFQFAHALSRLGYTVKTSLTDASTTITLKKITLAGSADETKTAFYTKGTIDLSKTSSTGLWKTSDTDTKQNFDWLSTDKTLDSDTKNSDTEYLFVIPQDFSKTTENADALFVIVEYTIKYGDEKPVTYTVSSQLKQNFEQGKAYSINLTFGLTPIEFDADVTTWKDTEQKDVYWN
ncbi:fimbrillin family protein [Segatella copri]|uniref:fimbrillin family protein n=1 Tax=Segatella copri TaxID=165179 RepID=UPI0025DF9317|nr:fimbrillin family protein [Segatella copri]MDV3105455.1 fimbrillin family protein [Segatella copri]MDV3112312.1 fimbrillin family protein [Segatella copri]